MRSALEKEACLVYGASGVEVAKDLLRLADAFRAEHPHPAIPPSRRMSESDAFLITYADTLQRAGEAPLKTLAAWLEGPLKNTVSTVHLLPFYPWSSDDGFAVKDYREVDPNYGTWRDVEAVGKHHRLMFDAVINHASAQGAWFQAYLRGEEPQRRWFRSETATVDTSTVVRPRTSPLLTKFDAADGERWLWTTFGPDQVDLDYRDPSLLLEVARVLLAYAGHGADVLRMDAVTYLWKELGTPCVHHPNTHAVLRLLRAFLETAAPWMVILTETNVPHAENLSYFGSGRDEAQMIYNFALPPLMLHTMTTGRTRVLQEWAASLATPSDETWFLNFLASHDGIGVRPVEGLLASSDVEAMVARTEALGGRVGMKREADGRETPYELSINYLDALQTPGAKASTDVEVARFAAAHAVMMALPGVPALYVHSLLGSRGAPDLVRATGIARRINRAKLNANDVARELADPTSLRAGVLRSLQHLLRVRRSHPAFHPSAASQVLDTQDGVFAVQRGDDAPLYAVHELAGQSRDAALPRGGTDLLTGERVSEGTLHLEPYAVRWIDTGT